MLSKIALTIYSSKDDYQQAYEKPEMTIPLSNSVNMKTDPEVERANEGPVFLQVYWKLNPEEDRCGQHNDGDENHVVFSNLSRDVITTWRNKISLAVN